MEKNHTYIWKDIVLINGKTYAESFPISGKMDDESTYCLDNFYQAVAEKHHVNTDDIKTYMMDNIPTNAEPLDFGTADCGCYIDNKPEWCMEL